MRDLNKIIILWIVGLTFFPIGLQLIFIDTFFTVFMAFFITINIMFFMFYYCYKEYNQWKRNKSEKYNDEYK